jgi:hypothetical protein
VSIGIAVFHDDPRVLDEVVDAIDSCEGVHLVATDDDRHEAEVALVGGGPLRTFRVERGSLVVLSAGDAVADARLGFEAGARAFLRWPDDAHDLVRVAAKAAAAASPGDAGTVIAVAGARGGAGATTIAALLAAAVRDSIVVDLDGAGAGQRAFAPDGTAGTSLERVLAAPVPEVVERAAEPHAAGRALYREPGDPVPAESAAAAISAAAHTAPLVVVDVGRLRPSLVSLQAARRIVVLADDVASLRVARAFLDGGGEASFVLNRLRRRGLRAGHVERALGQRPVVVVPPDRRLARAPDLGALPRRAPSRLRGLVAP